MEVKLKVNFFAGRVRYRRVIGGLTVMPDELVNQLPSSADVVVPPKGMEFIPGVDGEKGEWVQNEIEPDVQEDVEAALRQRQEFAAQLKAEKDAEVADAADKSIEALADAADATSGAAANAAQGEDKPKAGKSKS